MTLFLDNYLNIDFSLFFGLHHMRRSNPLKRHLGFLWTSFSSKVAVCRSSSIQSHRQCFPLVSIVSISFDSQISAENLNLRKPTNFIFMEIEN